MTIQTVAGLSPELADALDRAVTPEVVCETGDFAAYREAKRRAEEKAMAANPRKAVSKRAQLVERAIQLAQHDSWSTKRLMQAMGIDYADPGGRITVHPDDLVVHQSHEWTKKCDWCGAEWHASKYHPGNCGECGGPR